jgi:oxygen-independent coproporphyrinogen III oxidase
LLKNKADLLAAMHKEIELQRNYLQGQKVETIYFGGGTPSLLEADEIKSLLESLHRVHEIVSDAEITLEANPDDLTLNKIKSLAGTGINRLSIGIQSFRDQDLKWMNRAHTAREADYSVKAAQDHGFENITIDLIYSIPGMKMNDWKQNLQTAFALNVQHISAYGLTIEPKTYFGIQHKRGKLQEAGQEESSEQFMVMLQEMNENGFEQYEVSNFCKQGYESKHNSAYWKGAWYVGLGPSAHSYNGHSRQWNVANNTVYLQQMMSNTPTVQKEELTWQMKLNEYLMTGLRTKWGIDTKKIHSEFSFDFEKEYADEIGTLLHEGKMHRTENVLRLTPEGLLKADLIASDFFVTE